MRSNITIPALLAVITCTSCAGDDRSSSDGVGRAITEADATLSHGFSQPRYLVETASGRVFISDPRDDVIYAADFDADTVWQLGRNGAGPLEYLRALQLIDLGNDTILHVDYMSKRWLLIARDTIVAAVDGVADPVVRELSIIWGADRFGNVLVDVVPMPERRDGSADSVLAVLVNRADGSRDTVAKLAPDPPLAADKGAYYVEGESATLAPDGWLVVLRRSPYRVDWRSPDGKWTLGTSIEGDAPVLDAKERRWLDERLGMSRAMPDWEDRIHWPDRIPPVDPRYQRIFTATGDLVLRRQAWSGLPPGRYDVVNRAGVRTGTINLGEHQAIIGFGRKHLYLASTDEDGLVFISRHPW